MPSQQESTIRIIQITIVALALSSTAAAQDLRSQLVGSWDFIVAEVKAPDGKKSFTFGETPKGILIFAPDGRFAQIHVASDLPKIASNNRLTGTPEEYAEIMQGEAQTRTIDKLTADEFVNTNPNVAGGRGSASNFYKMAK